MNKGKDMKGQKNGIKTIMRYLITQEQVVFLPIYLFAYSQSSKDRESQFSSAVKAQAARKRKAKRDGKRSIWFGLGMSGLIGWSVIVPTVIGAAIGAWIDQNYKSRFSWTLTFMLLGLIIGCLSAWRWVASEFQGIQEDSDD